MFCIYKTDPGWINLIRTLQPDVHVNFWRKGTNQLKLPIGSWLYFNERKTRNIVGRGMLVGYEVMTIDEAWKLYGIGNGVNSLIELQTRAKEILDVSSSSSEIGCILLSELEFLSPENSFVISKESYAPQIVGPKYFEDNELAELHNKFSYQPESQILSLKQELTPYYEGEEKYSYRRGYERNSQAREECLKFHNYQCKACKKSLEDIYGKVAQKVIHVHHLNPIAKSIGLREVDPRTELIPLCPNCHTIAHLRTPPYTLDEIISFIKSQNND
ncbi:MAG: hypothetical protein WA123_09770 [Methylotenera sp.]